MLGKTGFCVLQTLVEGRNDESREKENSCQIIVEAVRESTGKRTRWRY